MISIGHWHRSGKNQMQKTFALLGLLFIIISSYHNDEYGLGEFKEARMKGGWKDPVVIYDDSTTFGVKRDRKEDILNMTSGYFTENLGQIPKECCLFYTPELNIILLENGYIIRVKEVVHQSEGYQVWKRLPTKPFEGYGSKMRREKGVVLKYTFENANPVKPYGREKSTCYSNYFIGNNPREWYINVPNYKEVVYPNVWEGIDVVFSLKNGYLKYDVVLHPGADPENIRIKVSGGRSLRITEGGELSIDTDYWDIVERSPVAFYSSGKRVFVDATFRIYGPDTFGFSLGRYDREKTVVIDPLVYSTYLGGTYNDDGIDVEIDDMGNVYVVGTTYSINFPVTIGAYDTTYKGGWDIFVSKINITTSTLVYSTYIGGSSDDQSEAIKVDKLGCVYVAGGTWSNDFPITNGSFDTTFEGGEAFILKLNQNGSSLIYSTYIGGSSREVATGIEVDPAGNAYVVGYTYSNNFTTTENAFDRTFNGKVDAFVCRVNANGTSLEYSTYVGGSDEDKAYDIALSENLTVYFTGQTFSSDFPVTTNAYESTKNTDFDVFVTFLNLSGAGLIYSTFLGGNDREVGSCILVDENNSFYVAGGTWSSDFPVTPDSYDTTFNPNASMWWAGFITKFNPTGCSLEFSTYFAEVWSRGIEMDIDSYHNVFITGEVLGGIPTTPNAYDPTPNGATDAFVSVLNSNGSNLIYSTYLGGSYYDWGNAIKVDSEGFIYVVGGTYGYGVQNNFPTTPGAISTTPRGVGDAFLSVLLIDDEPPFFLSDNTSKIGTTGDDFTFSVKVEDNLSGVKMVYVEYWFGNGSHINSSLMRRDNETWNYTFEIPWNCSVPLHYFFVAVDMENNIGKTPVKIVEIRDNDLPIITPVNFPTHLTTGEEYNFTVNTTDNIGVYGVWFEYWYGGGDHINVSMLHIDKTLWSSVIRIEDTVEDLFCIVRANDTSNNWAEFKTYRFNVEDNDAPTFLSDNTEREGYTGDRFVFSVEVSDNVEVYGVWVDYWYEGGIHINSSMMYTAENLWSYTIKVEDTLNRLYYRFHANDTSGNWIITEVTEVRIYDNDPPVFIWNSTPLHPTTGDPFEFKISVVDNVEVEGVWVEFWYGEGTHTNISMEGVGGDLWEARIIVEDTAEPLLYIFHAKDISGNWNSSGIGEISVIDNDMPVIRTDRTPRVAYTGDLFTFQVEIGENVGMQWVCAIVSWLDPPESRNVSLEDVGGGVWAGTILVPEDSVEPFTYLIMGEDVGGNKVPSFEKRVNVVDNDPPTLLPGEMEVFATTGDDYHFVAEARDNIELRGVYVEYWYGDGKHTNLTLTPGAGDVWTRDIKVANTTDTLYYIFHACDSRGNWNLSSGNITVIDNDPPTFGKDWTPTESYSGESFAFSVAVRDNVEVEAVYVEYWFGSGEHKNASMRGDSHNYTLTITIPEGDASRLTYVFHAVDTSGNWASTSPRKVVLKAGLYRILVGTTAVGALLAILFTWLFKIKRKRRRGVVEE